MFRGDKNIVEIKDYTETDQEFIIYLEKCNDAKFLEYTIEEKKKEIRDERLLKHLAKSILLGMKKIHSMGFVHADMKPANLLLHREESNSMPEVKICDFGVSQIMLKTEAGFEKALMKDRSGTAGYMAPEIKTNNTLVGPEIDVWAFGVILYEMAVAYKPTQVRRYQYKDGPIPFRARDWKHL